ncbi:MAG: carcinine hydrolase/isopenicillin-N N-acyltransferase family protein [Fuerstiella sp.]
MKSLNSFCRFLVALLATTVPAAACTTAVISGRVTSDGRPLLWKNRDYSSAPHNEVVHLAGGRYRAIGVVTAGSYKSVWMGVNESGFCIENSLSLDLKSKTPSRGPGNGALIRQALESCATVDDFRQLLQKTDASGRVTCGNFGVIDAQGGAALFEVGRTSHRMLDANDPEIAPHGYIVRSNFSMTGQELPIHPTSEELSSISSAGRYLRACSLLESPTGERISAEFLVRHCTRDLADPQGRAIPGTVNGDSGLVPGKISTAETISRATTVSAAVFHGVRPGEDPRLTTMYSILGDPKFSIAVPCWAVMQSIPEVLQNPRGGALGEIALTLRDWSFSGGDEKNVQASLLPGLWKTLWPVEDQILEQTRAQRESQTTAVANPEPLETLSHRAAETAMAAMKKALRQTKQKVLSVQAPRPPVFEEKRAAVLVP